MSGIDSRTISPEEALDEALCIGARELACWMEDNDVEAARLAGRRETLMSRALVEISPGNEHMVEKIRQLEHQQARISHEARRLHDVLRRELDAMQGQTRRFNGYRKAAKITPISSRFVSRMG